MEKTWTGREVMSVMVEHPGTIYQTGGVSFVLWDSDRSQFRITYNPANFEDGTASPCQWLPWALDATWREWKPEPEPDPKDRIYTGAEAFQLMAETPGRAFTPVDVTVTEFRVYAIDDRCEFQSAWVDGRGKMDGSTYKVLPNSLNQHWREYFPKPESKPTTGLSFDEAVARVRSGEAKFAYQEGITTRRLYRGNLDAKDWKVWK